MDTVIKFQQSHYCTSALPNMVLKNVNSAATTQQHMSKEEVCAKLPSNFRSNFTSNSGGKLKFKGKKCTYKTYIRAKQHEL